MIIICGVITFFVGIGCSFVLTMAYQDHWFKIKEDEVRKFRKLFDFMAAWMVYKQNGNEISGVLKEFGYRTIALYGVGVLGKIAIKEFQEGGINVKYGIDKNAKIIYPGISMITPDEKMEDVDAIVVTAISSYEEIKKILKRKTDIPVISLESCVK